MSSKKEISKNFTVSVGSISDLAEAITIKKEKIDVGGSLSHQSWPHGQSELFVSCVPLHYIVHKNGENCVTAIFFFPFR